jgi:hypothetical protein
MARRGSTNPVVTGALLPPPAITSRKGHLVQGRRIRSRP